MIPLNEITGSSLDALFVYMALLGILLLAASWLRLKIPLLKKYYIPASLIAGVIGLILGPYFLGIIPKEIMSVWSGMSSRLIVLIYAPMLMGKRQKSGEKLIKRASESLVFSYFTFFYTVCRSIASDRTDTYSGIRCISAVRNNCRAGVVRRPWNSRRNGRRI